MRTLALLSLCTLPAVWGDSGPDATLAPPPNAPPPTEPNTAPPPTPIPPPPSCSVPAGQFVSCDSTPEDRCEIFEAAEFIAQVVGSCDFSACCQPVSTCCPGNPSYFCFETGCACRAKGICFSNNMCCGKISFEAPIPPTRNLRETSDMIFEVGHPGIKDYERFCGEHDFEIALYVDDGHLVSISTPLEGAANAGCPHMAAHAVFTEGSSAAEKQLLVWYQEPVFAQDLHSIGVFKGADLAKAFNEVDASGDGVFNYLSNNCADFQINMASKLGIKVDRDVTTFVTRRLMEDSGKRMIERIKSNSKFSSFFGHRSLRASDMSDEELIQEVVEQRASKLVV